MRVGSLVWLGRGFGMFGIILRCLCFGICSKFNGIELLCVCVYLRNLLIEIENLGNYGNPKAFISFEEGEAYELSYKFGVSCKFLGHFQG